MTIHNVYNSVGKSMNKTADTLGINRCTARKYMKDNKGNDHFVRKDGDVYSLFVRIGG